ncbi:anthranilate synthase component I family protein [Thermaerobacter subterraneus]|uniref:Anthranilate synthase component 1 n=1 Tax=Thermaerobacter subterraneus DSM 13965 TaxID=867903 RepID=K6Q325_9FIRM|nr:anthranilate synthase component I family protein [Thermaerobacter subterraneus]EKP95653.1 anthranilate/para-aminobenzoate synthase component I [Thermaerobacter subterraneus DSM 13965]
MASAPATLVLELALDQETPVTLFRRLAGDGPGFILESLGGGERSGRYSYVGVRPVRELVCTGSGSVIYHRDEPGGTVLDVTPGPADPFAALRRFVPRRPVAPGFRFAGGAVGYLGYDAVRFLERLPGRPPADPLLPVARFMECALLAVLDHRTHRLYLMAPVLDLPGRSEEEARRAARRRLEEALAALEAPLPPRPLLRLDGGAGAQAMVPAGLHSNMAAGDFLAAVRRAQAYIRAGDVFQVVLSRRFEFAWPPAAGAGDGPAAVGPAGAGSAPAPGVPAGDGPAGAGSAPVTGAQARDGRAGGGTPAPGLAGAASAVPEDLDLYRALRVISPSPYMFFLRFDGETTLLGASPELLVRVEGRRALTRPLAGTRPRGRGEEDDRALERELLADPKERAEHTMLVDLGRNDLGRVCRPGTVRVERFMAVERYSHVMHLASDVAGELAEGRDAVDALAACFPAGTLTGAPKVRAMEIIDELEPVARGPYGGAVGYLGYDGDLDMCIAIRTLVLHAGRGFLQVGAGVVAGSQPEGEWAETEAKARSGLRALALAAALGKAPSRLPDEPGSAPAAARVAGGRRGLAAGGPAAGWAPAGGSGPIAEPAAPGPVAGGAAAGPAAAAVVAAEGEGGGPA